MDDEFAPVFGEEDMGEPNEFFGHFMRPRAQTLSSDSGFSVDSTASDVSYTSTSTNSTVKRRCVNPYESPKDHRASQRLSDFEDDFETNDGNTTDSLVAVEDLRQVLRDYTLTGPDLCTACPQRLGGLELVILRQPEPHHRARYQKEGSRGCIKDRSGNSCPSVQLRGCKGVAVLQAFVGTENGKVQPNPFYRACRVGGKHCTPCREKIVDGFNLLELDFLPENDWTLNIDCLGILKLRNADLEQLRDVEESRKRRKSNPKIRLVFRALVLQGNQKVQSIQVVSSQICCTPSPGMPEIHRVSHCDCPASGGTEIVILGRNFVKQETRIFIVEKSEDDEIMWERELELIQEHFHQVHVVGVVPPYQDIFITKSVDVCLVVRNKGKTSESYLFKYVPDESVLRHLSSSVGAVKSEGKLPDQKNKATAHQTLENFLGSGIQYCITTPAMEQPIFITIPQMPPSTSSHMDVASQQLGEFIVPYQQQQSYSPPVDQGFNEAGVSSPESQLSASDDELFDQLLRDILNESQQMDFEDAVQSETVQNGLIPNTNPAD